MDVAMSGQRQWNTWADVGCTWKLLHSANLRALPPASLALLLHDQAGSNHMGVWGPTPLLQVGTACSQALTPPPNHLSDRRWELGV